MQNKQKIKYIDSHSHPHFSAFEKDRSKILANMQEAQVATIAVGTSPKTSAQALELAKKQELVLGATLGVHPTEQEEFNEAEFEKLLSKKVCAVGECGLDYFRMQEQDKSRQIALFEKQIQFAAKHSLPLMLHIRSSQGNTNAHDDAFEILKAYKKEFPKLHLHMHFFTANIEVAKKFLELDASFGVPGVVTFAKEVQETVEYLPFEKILIESDAPYAAPAPFRGKRNEPSYVVHTLKAIAQIKRTDENELANMVLQNTKAVFNFA